MTRKRYFLLGGSGKLGTELAKRLDVDAPRHQNVDILNPATLNAALAGKAYAGIIHLAALTQAKLAEDKPLAAYRINVIGTRHVAEAARAAGTKLFYTSSDYVFDGLSGDYREEAVPRPANWYGATKFAGEMEVQNAGGPFAILRTSFRPTDWGFPTAYTNVYTSADYADVIAEELAVAIRTDVSGILHIGTPVKTFYELAVRRNPKVKPEECTDPLFPKRRNLNIDKWLTMKKEMHVS